MGATGEIPRCEGPLPHPLAFFLTWSTYGTWLPGDERGWVAYRRGWHLPNPIREREAKARMTDDARILNRGQREVVERTICDHCRIRGWELHAVNCRTNHLHVVVAANLHPDKIRSELKAWCTRRLKELEQTRDSERAIPSNSWAERGSKRYINDTASLEAVIQYVQEAQDAPRGPEQY